MRLFTSRITCASALLLFAGALVGAGVGAPCCTTGADWLEAGAWAGAGADAAGRAPCAVGTA